MGEWYTQYTTPVGVIRESEGTTCQRFRFTLNGDKSFRMYEVDTNDLGQVRDGCSTGEQTFAKRKEGTLSFGSPVTVVSCLKSSTESSAMKFQCLISP